jgi:diaminopropionate ammonia-lyase
MDELRAGLIASSPLCLVAATDGNHGRVVARMARLPGLGAEILVPDDMVLERRRAIVSKGARVTVVHGTYDDAIARSAGLADDKHLVS